MFIKSFAALLAAALLAAPVFADAADEKADHTRPAWKFAEGDFAPMFPFKIEKGAPNNITNVQTWSTPWADAGAGEILTARDGMFFKGDAPFRFMGTNTCFAANFCEKKAAEQLAATFARFGIRVVRLHHMDSHNIWGKNYERTKIEIDPEQLDRLDYLIAQFEKQGVYVNINLHVSRFLDERDGFENSVGYHHQCKGIDNFEPRMIELQKKYARDLLTHVNPYTGRAYTDDPGVAMIEINNENSVVGLWYWGSLDTLGAPYNALLARLWNDWLAKKYDSTDALKKAWSVREEPLRDDQITSKQFSEKLTNGWYVQTDDQSRQSISLITAAEANLSEPKTPETNVLKITVEKGGQAEWIPQLIRTDLKLEKDTLYTWSFKIRANHEGTITGGVRQDHAPWQGGGCDMKIDVSPAWKTYSHTFVATADDDKIRVAFASLRPAMEIELADVSLEKGGVYGLADGETLEQKTVPPVRRYGDAMSGNVAARRDFISFLVDLENGYWSDMYDFVKNKLGAKPPVCGTQLQYGAWYPQARLDYCDNHSYWHHPVFPNRSWDSSDWFVENAAMVNSQSGGTLSTLACNRVVGKAQTISEYDHAYPNLYGAEGNLMIAALGAFQNWTGINHFAWSHGVDFDPDGQSGFFDMCGNSAKIVHLPACRALLERRDVQSGPGKFAYTQGISEATERDIMASLSSGWSPVTNTLATDRTLAMACYSGVRLTDDGFDYSLPNGVKNITSWDELPAELGRPENGEYKNEFGELCWNTQVEGAGYFTVDTPGVKVFTGFVRDRSFRFDGLTLTPGKTWLDWTTISITAVSPGDKGERLSPGRYLIAATGLVQNADAKFVEYAEGKITTAITYGGSPGKAPALCEGIPLTISLDGISFEKVEAFALDTLGNRGERIAAEPTNTGCTVTFGPQYKTLWYELVIGE